MSLETAEDVAHRCIDLDLLTTVQVNEVWEQLGDRNVSVEAFTQHLIRRELLTSFQTTRLLRGDSKGFYYGKFRVLYLVGSGSFARVYRAEDRDSGEQVALKVLRNRFSDSEEHTGQFLREGRMGMQLRHPNIVPIYDVYSQNDTHFLTMGFVEGRNLREFLKIRKIIEPNEAVRLMIDVARGLTFAAEQGVSHRDMKLTNVLVSSRGDAQLVDFGLAAASGEMTDEQMAQYPNPRTIDYAGLERCTGVRKDDARSDIYFFGCMLYHLVTGVAPLMETRNRVKRLSRSRFEEVLPVEAEKPDLPPTLARLINMTMDLNPDHRHQTPRELLTALDAAQEKVSAEMAAAKESGQRQRVVMIVESDPQMQEILRDRLKKHGYRVLMVSNPYRALQRFDDACPARCVVFCAETIGHDAVEGFNKLYVSVGTQNLPSILLLDEDQTEWAKEAEIDDHRVVMNMPITMKALRTKIDSLFELDAARAK